MGPVHVGIRHDDDLAVTQLRQIKFISNAASQSGDNRHQLVIAVDLIQPGLFHVEHFAPQRKDRLEFPVPPALGGAAGGISLYDIDFRFLRISGLAVRQLARQGGASSADFLLTSSLAFRAASLARLAAIAFSKMALAVAGFSSK